MRRSPAVVEPGLVSPPVETVAETRVSTPAPSAVAAPVRSGADAVIQVVEERLDVGKRAVSRGKVRIRSSVVEKSRFGKHLAAQRNRIGRPPCRRPPRRAELARHRPVQGTGHRNGRDRRRSRRGEVGARRRGDQPAQGRADRVETIRDTVRSTKVDIDDGRIAAATELSAYERSHSRRHGCRRVGRRSCRDGRSSRRQQDQAEEERHALRGTASFRTDGLDQVGRREGYAADPGRRGHEPMVGRRVISAVPRPLGNAGRM